MFRETLLCSEPRSTSIVSAFPLTACNCWYKLSIDLISDVGLRPVYLGGAEQMGLLDSIASLWFALAFGQKKGRHLAFKVLGM